MQEEQEEKTITIAYDLTTNDLKLLIKEAVTPGEELHALRNIVATLQHYIDGQEDQPDEEDEGAVMRVVK